MKLVVDKELKIEIRAKKVQTVTNKIGTLLGVAAQAMGALGVLSFLWTLVELLAWAYSGDTIIIASTEGSSAGPIFTSLFVSILMIGIGIVGIIMVDEFYVNE